MKKNILLGLLVGLALLFSPLLAGASGADYAREKKWADEVVPGLVVGDPVYLQTPRGHHKFLTLFTPGRTPTRRPSSCTAWASTPTGAWSAPCAPNWPTAVWRPCRSRCRSWLPMPRAKPIRRRFPRPPSASAKRSPSSRPRAITQIAIVSHSMGSRMSRVYLAGHPDPAVKSWASLGISQDDYAALKLPILDLYGDNDLPPVLANAAKRKQRLATAASKQGVIARADHFYSGHEAEMVAAVADFLNATLK